ncbi:Vps62-related protein [Pseudomonas fluorescens]|uniref:DUF946 domain-containing protein n=1 Tax=Pseudomonas fluorescens TaxID=294 RepID=A0A423MH27_PSEFL|nr:Vps62-related protein [Pseudomonas fluorescens]RON83088.1 hypothetical protein BK670_08080 [Pseudomonas fluorescens]
MTTHDAPPSPISPTEPIRHDNLLINFTTEFLRVWDTRGSRAKPAAFWRPTPAADVLPGYFPLGDVASDDHSNITGRHVVAVVCEAPSPSTDSSRGKALRPPADYELIWKSAGSGSHREGAIWRPVPPEGYVALGSVCSDGYEKPSFNAVRCVRADLVSGSGLSEPVWNDKDSGALQRIGTWSAIPPSASSNEIVLAPGTFVGWNSHSRPASFQVYSLRIQIPLQFNPRPAAPVLEGASPASLPVLEKSTHTARLPWFAVKDPLLSRREQLRESPFYVLQRTDQYQLVCHRYNGENENRLIRWTAPRAQSPEDLRTFSNLTSIEFGAQWKSSVTRPFLFSARLNNDFTQCEVHSNDWLNRTPIEIAAAMAKNSSLAVYLMQSDYALLRADGTHVTSVISYTDANSLHFSTYTPQEPAAPALSAEEAPAPDPVEASVTANEIPAAPVQTELPTTTNNAP